MTGKKSSDKILKKAAKGRRGQRYSDLQKTTAVEWIQARSGRGTIARASRKFKIADSTLRYWLKEESATPVGVKNGKKRRKPKKRGRPKGSVAKPFKDKIEKIAKEATATQDRVNELLGKLGWPD